MYTALFTATSGLRPPRHSDTPTFVKFAPVSGALLRSNVPILTFMVRPPLVRSLFPVLLPLPFRIRWPTRRWACRRWRSASRHPPASISFLFSFSLLFLRLPISFTVPVGSSVNSLPQCSITDVVMSMWQVSPHPVHTAVIDIAGFVPSQTIMNLSPSRSIRTCAHVPVSLDRSLLRFSTLYARYRSPPLNTPMSAAAMVAPAAIIATSVDIVISISFSPNPIPATLLTAPMPSTANASLLTRFRASAGTISESSVGCL